MATARLVDKVVMVERACNHYFVFLRTAKWMDNSGGYCTHFVRVDTYYCAHCLEHKEVKKEAHSRDTPDWYRGE